LRAVAAAALLLAAGWAVPPVLWGLRNEAVHGQFIPLATNGGWTLWEGFATDREEVRRRPYEMRAEVARLGLGGHGDFYEVSRYYVRKTRDFALAHPLEAARIVAEKALLYWRPWVYDPYPRAARWGAGVFYALLFALALAGAGPLRGDAGWSPVWALMVNLTLLHAVLFTSVRYRLPLEPFLVCLAAAGAARLLSRTDAA
ncbi:MAG: hypothetical protein KGL53_04690, partial [Elusimicrobia bacterium]|nr:hypothetical protein [Elusimicrobiota bacterium]